MSLGSRRSNKSDQIVSCLSNPTTPIRNDTCKELKCVFVLILRPCRSVSIRIWRLMHLKLCRVNDNWRKRIFSRKKGSMYLFMSCYESQIGISWKVEEKNPHGKFSSQLTAWHKSDLPGLTLERQAPSAAHHQGITFVQSTDMSSLCAFLTFFQCNPYYTVCSLLFISPSQKCLQTHQSKTWT